MSECFFRAQKFLSYRGNCFAVGKRSQMFFVFINFIILLFLFLLRFEICLCRLSRESFSNLSGRKKNIFPKIKNSGKSIAQKWGLVVECG